MRGLEEARPSLEEEGAVLSAYVSPKLDGLTHSSLSQYLVLKAKVEESNRLAVETYRSHSRTREADSDDLIVVD